MLGDHNQVDQSLWIITVLRSNQTIQSVLVHYPLEPINEVKQFVNSIQTLTIIYMYV